MLSYSLSFLVHQIIILPVVVQIRYQRDRNKSDARLAIESLKYHTVVASLNLTFQSYALP